MLLSKAIERLLASGLPFALYRPAGEVEPYLVIQLTGEVKRLHSARELAGCEGFVVAPFAVSEAEPLLVIRPELELWGEEEIGAFAATLPKGEATKEKSLRVTEGTSRATYQVDFDRFHGALQRSEYRKLVLARNYRVERPEKLSVGTLFRRACRTYPGAFVWMAYAEACGTWLGATPEVLLKGDREEWASVALAGTQRMNACGDLTAWDAPRRKEQELVSEYLRAVLRSAGAAYREEGPFTAIAGGVAHLKSIFRFRLPEGYPMGELINQLHPTPALCGLPKEEARRFILREESIDRSYYGGYIGPFSSSRGECMLYVNLRSMEIGSDALLLYAGGGLLSTSEAESEWRETEDKLQTLLTLLRR